MKGLQYQLKNIRWDKMCILTFLIPVIVSLFVSLMPGGDFTSISENSFGVAGRQGDIPEWLEQYGTVTGFADLEELKEGINDPSTQMVGVVPDGIYTSENHDRVYRGTGIYNSHGTCVYAGSDRPYSVICLYRRTVSSEVCPIYCLLPPLFTD